MIQEKRRIHIRQLVLVLGLAVIWSACGGGSEEPDATETVAPTAEGRAPTPADLTGIWLQVEDSGQLGLLVQFHANRTFSFDSQGELATNPAFRGGWVVENGAMSFTSHGSALCSDGDAWAWQASVVEDGRLHIVHTEEGDGECRVALDTEWTLLRVTPRPHPAIRDIANPASTDGVPPTADDLPGIWMPVESPGLLVRLSADGTFAVDSGGNIAPNPQASVLGGYELAGDIITLSISGGHACDAPDGWTWESNLAEDGLLYVVYTTEARGQCRHETGTEWTLIRLSPASAAANDAIALGE